jgi:hypothetical protein
MIAAGFAMALIVIGSAARADLAIHPVLPMIHTPGGSTVVVEAVIENTGDRVVYLGSVSVDLDEDFAGNDAFADFAVAGPDSLLPGESWEGPVLRLTVALDAPIDDVHEVTLFFTGGLHRYDELELSRITFPLNDSVSVLAAPGPAPGTGTRILGVSPNPSRSTSMIAFELASEQAVDVRVYDVRGAAIRSLARGRHPAGLQTVDWNGRDDSGASVSPGIYFIRLVSADGVRRTKVVRMK